MKKLLLYVGLIALFVITTHGQFGTVEIDKDQTVYQVSQDYNITTQAKYQEVIYTGLDPVAFSDEVSTEIKTALNYDQNLNIKPDKNYWQSDYLRKPYKRSEFLHSKYKRI